MTLDLRLPWTRWRHDSGVLLDADDYRVATISGAVTANARADAVLAAVNHHAEMPALLRRVDDQGHPGDLGRAIRDLLARIDSEAP